MLKLGKGWDRTAPSWELSLIPALPAPTTPHSVHVPAWGFTPSSQQHWAGSLLHMCFLWP